MSVKRGDIFYADLSPVVGSEQGGLRPVLIIQNDIGNRYSPTVIAAAITSRLSKTRLPTHIDVYAERVGLIKDSVILLEQVRTLDKRRLKEKMGHLDGHMMEEVNRAIAVSVGLGDWHPGEREVSRETPTRERISVGNVPAAAVASAGTAPAALTATAISTASSAPTTTGNPPAPASPAASAEGNAPVVISAVNPPAPATPDESGQAAVGVTGEVPGATL